MTTSQFQRPAPIDLHPEPNPRMVATFRRRLARAVPLSGTSVFALSVPRRISAPVEGE